MKVIEKGFSKELDRKFVWIESYSKEEKVHNSFPVQLESIRALSNALKKFPAITEKKVVVSARIVS